MHELVRMMPEHWERPPAEPDLVSMNEVIDYILPISKDAFLSLPEHDVFIGLSSHVLYQLRTRKIIENIRPSWYRLTPFGRFLRSQASEMMASERQS